MLSPSSVTDITASYLPSLHFSPSSSLSPSPSALPSPLNGANYLFCRKLRTSEAGQLLLNLCFGLLGIFVMFIISAQAATWNKYVCAVTGGLLHYLLLASFFLMAAEAINLLVKLVVVLGIPSIIKNRYVLKAGLISWSKFARS